MNINVTKENFEEYITSHLEVIRKEDEVKVASKILSEKNINPEQFVLMYTLVDILVKGYMNQLEANLNCIKHSLNMQIHGIIRSKHYDNKYELLEKKINICSNIIQKIKDDNLNKKEINTYCEKYHKDLIKDLNITCEKFDSSIKKNELNIDELYKKFNILECENFKSSIKKK